MEKMYSGLVMRVVSLFSILLYHFTTNITSSPLTITEKGNVLDNKREVSLA